MVKEKTISSVAQEMLDNLEFKIRANEEEYYCCKNSVQWQTDIIREAHPEQRLPSDEVYDVIYETLESLIDVETEDEASDRIAEIEADTYTSNLTKWLHSHNGNVYYLTQALEEFGSKDGFQVLAQAQYIFKHEIANALLNGIQEYINA